MSRLSVIVPTLDEEAVIEETLRSARQPGVAEILVVDGGSHDRTVERAAPLADRVLFSPRGRAVQMNAGARVARGDVLLFLHADTRLPPRYPEAVFSALADERVCGGRFDLRLEPSSPLLALTATLINLRSRATRVATGDQALFVRRSVFEALGGYPEWPLMEDLALSRAMKRAGRIACLRAKVVTSSRRWRTQGVLRTIVRMWTLRLLFYAGVPPERLARHYPHAR
ncbi:MAG: glycosyl transferase [Candidatus Binatia bacterium]|nr:MAG: glycosyl transferase [Candidatus Binatia bacterium]